MEKWMTKKEEMIAEAIKQEAVLIEDEKEFNETLSDVKNEASENPNTMIIYQDATLDGFVQYFDSLEEEDIPFCINGDFGYYGTGTIVTNGTEYFLCQYI